ncbi:hypothetical protein AYI68_g2514 [Smittium mucronatum]|uniref:Uncharacterized protein n=1 Tax=Smittium mucronatum TaxID=133383 RepID=A0A1R0H2L5_9FUNG|nr:hypothetical protein AYI68_g2514 [Smittium mucronatum]
MKGASQVHHRTSDYDDYNNPAGNLSREKNVFQESDDEPEKKIFKVDSKQRGKPSVREMDLGGDTDDGVDGKRGIVELNPEAA